jgi:hypothetical protein
MGMRTDIACACWLLAAPLAAALAAEPVGRPEIKGPLAGLPSRPGAHLAKINVSGRSRLRLSGFYDPGTNAHYFHAASVSRTDNVIWVYRHKRAGR